MFSKIKSIRTILVLSALISSGIAEAEGPSKANESMQKVLDALKRLGVKPIESLISQEARKRPSPTDAVDYHLAPEHKLPTAPNDIYVEGL